MNSDQARALEIDFVNQFRDGRGGLTGATSYLGAPVDGDTLSKVTRKLRRLPLGDALWLCAVNDRADLLRSLADLIDAQKGPGAIAQLAHLDVYDSADLAREIDEAEQDGRYTPAEIRSIQRKANINASNGAELKARADRLTPGPIDPED